MYIFKVLNGYLQCPKVYSGCLFPDENGGKELNSKSNITSLKMDVTKQEDIDKTFEEIKTDLAKRSKLYLNLSRRYC